MKMIEESIADNIKLYLPEGIHDNWNYTALLDTYKDWVISDRSKYNFTDDEFEIVEQDEIQGMIFEDAQAIYEENEKLLPEEVIRELERKYILNSVDTHWMDHIDNMEQLKAGIHLRSYGQHDPVVEYRLEGFDMFDEMIASIREDTAKLALTHPRQLAKQIIDKQRRSEAIAAARRLAAQKAGAVIDDAENDTEEAEPQSDDVFEKAMKREQVAKPTATSGDGTDSANKTIRKGKKIGRNDPCPCGSGKKYKKCCGRDL
jgi:preprotein translocase subunit SecA